MPIFLDRGAGALDTARKAYRTCRRDTRRGAQSPSSRILLRFPQAYSRGRALDRAGLTEASRGSRPISTLLALGYVLAGVIALAHAGDTLRAPDEFEYLSIGQNVALHAMFSMDGQNLTAWRSPGMPAIIAVLWRIWPSVYLIKALGVGCWMATAYITAKTAACLHSAAAGYVAATLYLLYIYQLYAATTLYPQTFAGLLVAASVAAVVLPITLTPRRQALLAAALTLQILLIPNCIVVAAAVYPYALLRGRLGMRSVVAAGAIIMLVILSWCYRNQQAIGGFTFTTSMGVTLYAGNRDPVPDPIEGSSAGISNVDEQANGLSEIENDKYFRRRSAEWMKAHPLKTIGISAEKFIHWFAYENKYETSVEVPAISLLSLSMAFIYYPVLVGASVVAIRSRRRNERDFAILSWIIYLLASLSYALFLTRIRYRLPFDTLLFCVAPGLLIDMARKYFPTYTPELA